MASKEEVLKNPLFKALQKVGHSPEGDIYTWSQGMAFHNANLLKALEEVPASKIDKILKDIWTEFSLYAPEKVKKAMGLDVGVNVGKINKFMSQMLSDRNFWAIKGVGGTVEEAILSWVKAFAIYDFAIYTYLEKHLGSKECFKLYMGLWETFALAELDAVKKELGITKDTKIDMDLIAKISRKYWESIACPYKVIKHSKDVHIAEIEDCPYWKNMKAILGEEKARSMTLKCEAAVSVNYYDAILKALGVFDKYSFTMDKFQCCGDECCRVRFEVRK